MKKRILVVGLCLFGVLGYFTQQRLRDDPLIALALGINNNEESTQAFNELLLTMQELAVTLNKRPGASAESYRALLHMLQIALRHGLEHDRERPEFKVSSTRNTKGLGDNPDAFNHRTIIRGDRHYRIDGNMAGAEYVSITVQEGEGDGSYADGIVSVLNSTEFDVAEDGSFSIELGPESRQGRNYIQLTERTAETTTRHYFEKEIPIAADLSHRIPIYITNLDDLGPPPRPSDESIARSIRRVKNMVSGRLRAYDKVGARALPAFVSMTPNELPLPVKPGTMANSNADAAYAQAPFLLADDEALIIRGRFPKSVTSNVVLWNVYLQSFDYLHRQVSLNRAQTVLEADGSFKMIVAHQDPGHPNWLDTEGRNFGLMYWRFLLPEGKIEPLTTEVVKFSTL